MSRIEQINTEKPLSFSGYRNTIDNNAEMTQLAIKLDCSQLLNTAEPEPKAEINLSVEDSSLLLNYLKNCAWREGFDENLQGMSETEDGEPLLTGWMSIDEFNNFIKNAGLDNPDVKIVIGKLHEASIDWKSMGIDDVYFDGYELTEKLPTKNYVWVGNQLYLNVDSDEGADSIDLYEILSLGLIVKLACQEERASELATEYMALQSKQEALAERNESIICNLMQERVLIEMAGSKTIQSSNLLKYINATLDGKLNSYENLELELEN